MFVADGFRNRSPSRFEVNALINAYQSTSYNSNENASPDSSGSEGSVRISVCEADGMLAEV